VDSLWEGDNIFRWTVTNGVCPASSDDVKITRELSPSPAFAGEDKETDIPVAELRAQGISIGTGLWSVVEGNAVIPDPQNPVVTASMLSSGINIFRWTVRNGVCPENSDDITVTLNPLKIPNAFSPNGDGFNDLFVIPGLEYYPNTSFHVFNRWGSEVYTSNDYHNNWNGTNMLNGRLADDTYYYIIEIPSQKSYSGFLIIKH
jgi:gliding motility-associated-like protein